jgi:hypothetical protein
MQGRRHQHVPRPIRKPQTSEAGVGWLRRSDVQCAEAAHPAGDRFRLSGRRRAHHWIGDDSMTTLDDPLRLLSNQSGHDGAHWLVAEVVR